MNEESFKVIKEYPFYWISKDGRIWNSLTQRYIKASAKYNGYMQVKLQCADGRRKTEYLHRLVAITYLDNPEHLPEVDHIDGDRGNNNVSNLRWVTRKENCRNKTDNREVYVYNLKHELLFICSTVAETIEKTGVSQASIYAVLRGDFDSCKGFIFSKHEI